MSPLAIRSPRSPPGRWRRSIAVWLLKTYGSSVPIAVYLALAALVTLIALAFTRETKGVDLADIDAADLQRAAA